MTTVKVRPAQKDPRPKRPRVDKGAEREALVRQLFALSVDDWFDAFKKENPKEKGPDKEVKGDIVDNLTALFCSAIDTTVDAATDTYLSTFDEEEEEEGEADVVCPKCDAGLVLDEEPEEGDEIECPECQHSFEYEDAS